MDNFDKYKWYIFFGIFFNIIFVIGTMTLLILKILDFNQQDFISNFTEITKIVLFTNGFLFSIIGILFSILKYKKRKCVSVITILLTFISFNIISGILFSYAYEKNKKLKEIKNNKKTVKNH